MFPQNILTFLEVCKILCSRLYETLYHYLKDGKPNANTNYWVQISFHNIWQLFETAL